MKVRVPVKNLTESLRKVLPVVSSRSTLPILNNILLQANDNTLSLSTTDMEVSITTTIPVTVEREGQTTVPAKKLGQIVATFSSGDVELDTDTNLTTSITCGNALFKIMGIDPSEFPKTGDIQEDRKIVFDNLELLKILKKIGYAVSNDQTRIVLNGILLSVRGGNITTVATDGRRLALVEKIVDDTAALTDGEVILPTKVVNELQKLLEAEGQVTISISESFARFVIGDTALTSKLIAGTYPNYRQVIPNSFKNSIALPREAFSEVLNRVATVVNDSGASVRFLLENDNLILTASSADVGEAKEPMTVSYEGEPVNISFNPGYLKDPLRNLECDEFTLRFNDEFKPVVVLGDEGFLYVIMPMRN